MVVVAIAVMVVVGVEKVVLVVGIRGGEPPLLSCLLVMELF